MQREFEYSAQIIPIASHIISQPGEGALKCNIVSSYDQEN